MARQTALLEDGTSTSSLENLQSLVETMHNVERTVVALETLEQHTCLLKALG